MLFLNMIWYIMTKILLCMAVKAQRGISYHLERTEKVL